MTSPRLLIAMLMLFVLAQVICNFMEGNQMIHAAEGEDISEAWEFTQTTSVDTLGTAITWIDKPIDFMKKVFAFDYNMFYDVYVGYTETTCTAAGGAWQSDSTCKFANDFTIIRYLLMCIGIIMWVELALVLRRLTLG
jgi:hypothetical protein